MFYAKYLSARDDIRDVLSVRSQVRELDFSGSDEKDASSVHVVVYDEGGVPFGCGRMYIDARGWACFDSIGVLVPYRRQLFGDLITSMLLSRARLLNAPAIEAKVPDSLLAYFSRYGFETAEECAPFHGESAHLMRIIDNRIRFESCSSNDDMPMCTGDCAHCPRRQ